MNDAQQNPTPTTMEERDKVHASLHEAIDALKAKHPEASFVVQVATVDVQQGAGYDVLTLYSNGDALMMFFQALGDTMLSMSQQDSDTKIIAPH